MGDNFLDPVDELTRDDDAQILYAAMCRYAEARGYHRRSLDEGGWWDDRFGGGDMTLGVLVEELLRADGIDLREAPTEPGGSA